MKRKMERAFLSKIFKTTSIIQGWIWQKNWSYVMFRQWSDPPTMHIIKSILSTDIFEIQML